MLELTRRMALKRNCFGRIEGAYLNKDGFVDGTFNKHFQNLSAKDQQKKAGEPEILSENFQTAFFKMFVE